MPHELETLRYLDRFGVQAVYGRVLSAKEIRQMTIVENLINAYKSREQSGDWVNWAKDHKEMNKLLELGLKLNGQCS